MSHVAVTGAAGFVGQGLVRRLLSLPHGPERLTVVDQRLDPQTLPWLRDERVQAVEGDFASASVLDALLASPVQQLFHLASVPGALAEREPVLGMAANLTGPQALLAALARRHAGLTAPRVVFASSIAVYGTLAPEIPVHEDTVPEPALSYGTHKRMIELLLADFSRRGELDGVSLRLPGIVARPSAPTGHGSAFMSDLIRRGMAGEPYECPVTPQARCWWMSLPTCVDNLLHAATIARTCLPDSRVVQLPVLATTVSEIVQAIGVQAPHAPEQLSWRPNENIQRLFGAMPLLITPLAREIGFIDDDHIGQLLARSLKA